MYMKNSVFLLVIVWLFAVSCGSDSYYENTKMATVAYDEMTAPQAEPAVSESVQPSEPAQTNEKKIIKTARLNLEVSDYSAKKQLVLKMIQQFGAYASSDNEENSAYRQGTDMVIRVPAASFDTLVNSICTVAKFIHSREISATDVTEEFIDITARLKNKRAVEAQYVDLLKRAKNISEILEVEEHLRVIREEIESREGRLKYLTSQVGYSTINLSMYQAFSSPEYKQSFFDKVADALGGGWSGFVSFIIGLLYIWPFLIIFALVVWWLLRWRRRRAAKRKSAN